MRIHHDKHHAAYIDNLNKLNTDNLGTAELLKSSDQKIINNLGGHLNHSFFWEIMSPRSTSPSGDLLKSIDSVFGDLDKFKAAFTEKALGVFGSGWAFLIKTKEGKLELKRHSFQNSPLMNGSIPILGIDVWEHAYYLKYQNRRAEYIDNWWNVVNWHQAAKNFESSGKVL
jgi:Fe-Mn family superoxide dismutase